MTIRLETHNQGSSALRTYLDFEKPVAEFEGKIADLRSLSASQGHSLAIQDDISRLETKAEGVLRDLYAKLTPWQKTQVARHPERPHALNYIQSLFTEFTPLAGDRAYGEDAAIVAGFARFKGESVCVMGHEKGSDTESRLKHNFGMAKPEGYRKAVRLMEMAERFDIPVISFIDTAGAYPGVASEERGQAEAIARSTEACLNLKVPNIAVIIGEGGSGGAIAIATANRVLMLEHAIYSVISPEGAASILWHDSSRAQDAATNMKITAQDLIKLKVIDQIIPEPNGGAHRDPEKIKLSVSEAISDALDELKPLSRDELQKHRHEKFLAIGRNLS